MIENNSRKKISKKKKIEKNEIKWKKNLKSENNFITEELNKRKIGSIKS